MLAIRAGGGENLADELIVRAILSDGRADPLAEPRGAFAAEELAVHHQ